MKHPDPFHAAARQAARISRMERAGICPWEIGDLVVDKSRRVFEVTAVLPGPVLALRRLVVDSAGRVMFGQYDGELMHRSVRDGMLLDDAWRVSQGV
jgi:hypothetical protein